jgi:hypothetical protein
MEKIWKRILIIKKKNNKMFKKIKKLKIKKSKQMFFFKKTLKKNYYISLWKYRKYNLYHSYSLNYIEKFLLEKYIHLKLILKNSPKIWAYRYILSSFIKFKFNFLEIQYKRPITHSKGFRLKKPKRV